jgi:hypothetical protein
MQSHVFDLTDKLLTVLKDENPHTAIKALKMALILLPTNSFRLEEKSPQEFGVSLSEVG